jgi:hypothetical protein
MNNAAPATNAQSPAPMPQNAALPDPELPSFRLL